MRYRHCTAGEAGFSLLEVLVATAITVGVGAATFQLFHQNERIFRDQSLKLEMQQSARLIASQVADDVRMTGQGIPALLGDAILPGSGASLEPPHRFQRYGVGCEFSGATPCCCWHSGFCHCRINNRILVGKAGVPVDRT